MKTEMIQKEKKILHDIQSIEKEKLADITKVKKETEQKRDEVAQHLQSLQKVREQPDVFLFFKVSSVIPLFFTRKPAALPGTTLTIFFSLFLFFPLILFVGIWTGHRQVCSTWKHLFSLKK